MLNTKIADDMIEKHTDDAQIIDPPKQKNIINLTNGVIVKISDNNFSFEENDKPLGTITVDDIFNYVIENSSKINQTTHDLLDKYIFDHSEQIMLRNQSPFLNNFDILIKLSKNIKNNTAHGAKWDPNSYIAHDDAEKKQSNKKITNFICSYYEYALSMCLSASKETKSKQDQHIIKKLLHFSVWLVYQQSQCVSSAISNIYEENVKIMATISSIKDIQKRILQ